MDAELAYCEAIGIVEPGEGQLDDAALKALLQGGLPNGLGADPILPAPR